MWFSRSRQPGTGIPTPFKRHHRSAPMSLVSSHPSTNVHFHALCVPRGSSPRTVTAKAPCAHTRTRTRTHTHTHALQNDTRVYATFVMIWGPDAVHFYTFGGLHSREDPIVNGTARASMLGSWSFVDKHYIPTPGLAQVHVNLWLQSGKLEPSVGHTIACTLHDFDFSDSTLPLAAS